MGHGPVIAVLITLFVTAWLVAVLFTDVVEVIVFNPHGKTGFEIFLALGQLFGALILGLASLEPPRPRLRWVAMALLVLGLGALGFGYLVPLFKTDVEPGIIMYGSIFTRIVATVIVAIGLVPARAPTLRRPVAIAILLGGGIAMLSIVVLGDHLPVVLTAPSWEAVLVDGSHSVFPGLTAWHHALSLIPLVLSAAAVVGTLRHLHEQLVDGWMVAGVTLFAGAQLHAMFWPSGYSSILTTTSILRFAWTGVAICGAIVELHALTRERLRLLEQEQERVRQLEDLNILKRDFSSMVAHELGTPLAAIGNLAHLIAMGALPQEDQQKAADRIQGEARILQLLVRDVQDSADVEREDFAVRPRVVQLGTLFEDARSYAGTVRTTHPITVAAPDGIVVMADPERIGQVIRNLLNNAVRHTPRGTPIQIGAYREEGGIRVEVADKGPGIDPQDRLRILEKFARGAGAGKEGRGLGLYLSRRILHAHGTDLLIASEPGEGARFCFRLEEAT